MGIVKGDDFSERMHWGLEQFSEIGIEIGLKFMQEYCGLRVRSAHLLSARNIGIVDDDRSKFAHLFDGSLNNGICPGTVAKIDLAGDTNPCSAQAVEIEKRRVVALEFVSACLGSGIAGIYACQRAKQCGCIGDRASDWSNGILAMGDRNNTSAADEANRWFDANNCIS